MPRAPDPLKEKAKALHLEGMKLIEIANQLNLPEGTIRGWKSRYKWDCNVTNKKRNATKRKRGGQPNNTNAVGNTSSLPGNKKAEKHGLFSKYLPEETLNIVNNMSLNPIDVLWDNIQIAYAAIIRAQKISYVKDIDDKTRELVGESHSSSVRITEKTQSRTESESYSYDVQQAWDKQSNFMKAQARAQSELRSMIKQYDELLKSELATEEQKLRIEKLRVETAKLSGSDNNEALAKLDEVLGSIKGVI